MPIPNATQEFEGVAASSLATDMAGINQLCPIDNDGIMNR